MSRSYLFLPVIFLSVLGCQAYSMADVTLINLLSTDQAGISVTLNNQIVNVQDRAVEGISLLTNSQASATVCDASNCNIFRIEDAHQACDLDAARYGQQKMTKPDAWLMSFYANGVKVGDVCAPLFSTNFLPMVHAKLYITSRPGYWGEASYQYTATFTAGFYGDDSAVAYTW